MMLFCLHVIILQIIPIVCVQCNVFCFLLLLFFTSYTFGPALFVGWIGGGVLLIGGILKSLAFREMIKDEKPR